MMEGKPILMSLNPQWFSPIATGRKWFEVRKHAPMQKHPYKVYLYCTKGGEAAWLAGIRGQREPYLMNGTVCGEFTCVETREMHGPWQFHTIGTGLSEAQLINYAAGDDTLYYMMIQDMTLYNEPKKLEDFGMSRAPMSWQYLPEKEK